MVSYLTKGWCSELICAQLHIKFTENSYDEHTNRVRGYTMHWNYGTGMGFGWLFMIIFWALVIIGIVFLIRSVMSSSKTQGKTETAFDILKKRYAKGEISKEEFEEKKKDVV
jgi:putative membrane protein